ncbi:MAG: tetratricopeptide repeat protein [Ignavibacteriaceae bacterium]|nr:tetratricopeptide repeat protein [Ignavibacteriaceae bacterium]
MLTKRKKLTKKEIKEDKLVTTYYKVYNFILEQKNKLGIYAGGLVVVIAAIYFYMNNKAENNNQAGTQLARVMNLYDSGSYLEAIEGRQGTNIAGLKKIVADYGSTENGEIAKIYLAHSYLMLGNIEEAFKYYEDYSGGNDIFKATALAGEAGYYAYKNDFAKAAELYLNASRISKENVLNPEYMLKAAINFIEAGEKEEAKELLETIRKDYQTSTAFREVDKYLTIVN